MTLSDFEYLTTKNNNPIWYKDADCQYPLICPKGTRVKFLGVLKNFYGTWYRVEHNGKEYYIYPEYCDGNVIIKTETKSCFRADLNDYVTITFLTDRYGKQYVMDEKGEIEML